MMLNRYHFANLTNRLRKFKTLLFLIFKSIVLLNKILFFKPFQRKVIITLSEHIGDIVACEPVSRYAKSTYKNHSIFWVINNKYKSIIELNPNIDKILTVNNLSEWIFLKLIIKRKCFNYIKIIDLHINNRVCTTFGFKLSNKNILGLTLDNYYNFGNLLESFTLAAGIVKLQEKPILYFDEGDMPDIKLPAKYIVIQTQSNELDRNWSERNWVNLFADIFEEFDYYIIEVGLKSELNYIHPNYLNLCNKLTLREIAWVISRADCFIGIDSAFAHFANALNIPFIAILGKYRAFKKYLPYSGDMNSNRIIYGEGPAINVSHDKVTSAFKSLVNK